MTNPLKAVNPFRTCLRRNGTERAWFLSREQALAFAADPANPAYRDDVPHLCRKCGLWHLSRPEWLSAADRALGIMES